MKALNLSGGKHLSAATMFWPDTLSCTLQPSSKGREISQSQEKRRRAEGFSRAVSSNHLLNDPTPSNWTTAQKGVHQKFTWIQGDYTPDTCACRNFISPCPDELLRTEMFGRLRSRFRELSRIRRGTDVMQCLGSEEGHSAQPATAASLKCHRAGTSVISGGEASGGGFHIFYSASEDEKLVKMGLGCLQGGL